MTSEEFELLTGQVAALDILLRGLYAKWATESPTPRAWTQNLGTEMIESVRGFGLFPQNKAGDRIRESVIAGLHHFFQEVDARLKAEGFQE